MDIIQEHLKADFKRGIVYWKKVLQYNSKVKVGDRAGCLYKDGYRVIKVGNKRYVEHRIIWYLYYGKWPQGQIDHINHIRSDNRIANLRDNFDPQKQQYNRKPNKNNTSGYRGVWFHKGKWEARLRNKGKLLYLGRFNTVEEANKAYQEAVRRLHVLKRKSTKNFGF